MMSILACIHTHGRTFLYSETTGTVCNSTLCKNCGGARAATNELRNEVWTINVQ